MKLPLGVFTLLLLLSSQAYAISCTGCAGSTSGQCKASNRVCTCPGCSQLRCQQLGIGVACTRSCVAGDCSGAYTLRAGRRCFTCARDGGECCTAKTCSNQNVACNETSPLGDGNLACSTCDASDCCAAKTCGNQNVTCAASSVAEPANATCSACGASDCCRAPEEQLKRLVAEQRPALNILLIIGALILGLNLVIVIVSKFVYKDKNANYITMLQCSLGFYDAISDCFFLQTIAAARGFHVYVLVGGLSLGTVFAWNFVAATFIIRTEKARKSQLQNYSTTHQGAMALMLLLSPLKSNFILILDSRLFLAKTNLFDAPLPQKLRTKFTIASMVSLVLEDCVQIVLVSILQKDISGWTALNGVSFACSLLSLLGAAAMGLFRLKKSHATRALKSMSADLSMAAADSNRPSAELTT